MRIGGRAGDRERGGHFAGEPRQILLHRLEFSDRPLEGDALIGVGDAEREDRFERAGGLHAAHGRAHQHQRCAVEAFRRRRAAQRLDALEGHDVRRIAGRRAAIVNPAIFGRDQRDGVVGQHGDVLRIRCERNAERAAAERAIFAECDAVERPGRGDGHGACRRLQSRARQQPAGNQGLRQRHRQRRSARQRREPKNRRRGLRPSRPNCPEPRRAAARPRSKRATAAPSKCRPLCRPLRRPSPG